MCIFECAPILKHTASGRIFHTIVETERDGGRLERELPRSVSSLLVGSRRVMKTDMKPVGKRPPRGTLHSGTTMYAIDYRLPQNTNRYRPSQYMSTYT
jgi:hypothetical protein